MTTVAHDAMLPVERGRLASGLGLGLLSAITFGLSGPLASGLLATGWSPGAAVEVRIAIGALLVLPFGVRSLRGRWSAVRRSWRLLVVYGLVAVAGAQFCYFSAVAHMAVGPAILIEYTAPAAVVGWLWLRHGERPGRLTLTGAAVAAIGLVLVLDLLSGADLSAVGVLWALAAMVGAATYFVVSADESNGLPPLALASGGLVTGALALGVLGLLGVLPMHATSADTSYAGTSFPWWAPLLALGALTAAVAYVSGIAASRRLGSRLASFVALLEVVSGVLFAWLLLSQLPGPVQLLGGLLILTGVVAVRLGERTTAAEPAEVTRSAPRGSARPPAAVPELRRTSVPSRP